MSERTCHEERKGFDDRREWSAKSPRNASKKWGREFAAKQSGVKGRKGRKKRCMCAFSMGQHTVLHHLFFCRIFGPDPGFFSVKALPPSNQSPPPPPWSPGKRRAAGYPAHPSPILLQITSPMHAPRLGQMSSSSTRPQENYRPGRLLTHAQSRPDDGRRPSPHLVRPLVRRRPH